MGRSNKPNPNIGGKLGLVAGIVSAVTPVAIEFIDRIPRKDETEPSEELISMPELLSLIHIYGRLFLVIHSGSRHLGTEVADYYQNEGRLALWGGARHQIQETIAQLKAEGRFQEIQKTITALKKEHVLDIPKDLAYVEGKLFDDYIHDLSLIHIWFQHGAEPASQRQ